MTISGNIYGVVLNDAAERERLAPQLCEKPYSAPPQAPVIYMKPSSTLLFGSAFVPASTGLSAATSVALLFARDAARVSESEVAAYVGAMALALDLSIPGESYYRPAVTQKNGDGRLAMGAFVTPTRPGPIRLLADGETIHEWSLDRLVRPVEQLVADLSAFMTLKAGDVLLVGLPGDAPTIRASHSLRIEADALPTLELAIRGEKQ